MSDCMARLMICTRHLRNCQNDIIKLKQDVILDASLLGIELLACLLSNLIQEFFHHPIVVGGIVTSVSNLNVTLVSRWIPSEI